MKKIFLSLLLLGSLSEAMAQSYVYKFWIELKDKENNGYSIDNPSAFLSQRAIERRAKQNIPITTADLPVSPQYVLEIEQRGVKVLHTSRWFNSVTISCNDSAVLKEIRKLPFVVGTRLLYNRDESIEGKKNNPAIMEYLMTMEAPKSPENESDYGFGLEQISMLNGDKVHASGFTGDNIVIAVLDAGFYKMNEMKDFDHLRQTGRLLGTYDFVNKDTLVYEDDMHGMNVLSCMAAYTPGRMIGTAPGASYWLLRTEDANSEFPIEESNWIAGAEFADSVGADLINSSLGYTTYDNSKLSYTYKNLNGSSLISRAATHCAKVGMIVCNAAGNEGSSKWKYVGVPADADSIITVGGVDAQLRQSTFSSFGPTADGRVKPTVVAMATATFVSSSKGKHYQSQGTSFASPVLCGMVASLWSAHPTKTNMEIIRAIEKSGHQYMNPDNVLGYGIPDFVLANRFLGGDSEFNYTQDQWLTEIPSEYDKSIPIEFYSSKKQDMKIEVRDHKGRKIRDISFNLAQGEFLRFGLNELPKSKKPITLIIVVGGESKTYSLSNIQ